MAAIPEEKPKKAPRIHRFAIGVNVLIQIALVFFIIAVINYLGFKHYKRWDFSRSQKYALSDQTKQLIENLPKPIKIYEFFSPDPRLPGGEIFPDIEALLKEYQYAAPGKVEVEKIDPFKNLSRARELSAQYKFGNENVVVLDYQGHSKILNVEEMAQYDESGDMYGQQQPKLVGFRGEQALTSAMMEVSEGQQNKVYLIGGKGGPELTSDDLAVLNTYMQRQNLKAETLTLMNVESVPADAKVLMLIGPKYDLTDREMKLLQDYWDKQGRLFIALDPNGNTPKLTAFLRNAGISPMNDRVLRTMAVGPVMALVRDVESGFSETSPVTKKLKGVDTIFMDRRNHWRSCRCPECIRSRS